VDSKKKFDVSYRYILIDFFQTEVPVMVLIFRANNQFRVTVSDEKEQFTFIQRVTRTGVSSTDLMSFLLAASLPGCLLISSVNLLPPSTIPAISRMSSLKYRTDRSNDSLRCCVVRLWAIHRW
jgi:hypothetical protein